MKVLVMGLGAIGHTIAATIKASQIDVLVSKSTDISVISSTDGKYENKINNVYTYEELTVIDYDYLIVTLPYQYKINRLNEVLPRVSKQTTIVFIPGNQGILSYMPEEIYQHEIVLFERVIHIARTEEYGSSVRITGTKKKMHVAYSKGVNKKEFEGLFPQVTNFISDHHLIDISMVSSNAVIHNPRTYRAFKNEKLFGQEFYFYKTWTDEDSKLFIELEKEVMAINQAIEKKESFKIKYYSMFEHFDIDEKSPDATELTKKITTNKAFETITFFAANESELAMNRYVVDDMVIALNFYRELAKKYAVDTPLMDYMFAYGDKLLNTIEKDLAQKYHFKLNLNHISD